MSYEPLKITDATYEKQNKKMRSKHKSETGKTLGKRLTSGVDPRRVSFACRFAGMKGPMKDANGKPTKKAMALKKWGFSSVGAAAKFCHANKGKSPNKVKEFDPEKYLTKKEEEESVDLTRKGGPRVNNTKRINKLKKEKEKSNEIEHNVESKMDEYPPKHFHETIKNKSKS